MERLERSERRDGNGNIRTVGGVIMFYDRKVKYLDYYERGERVRGGGHAKLEVRDGRLRLELAVTGMHVTDSFVRDVFLCAEGRESVVGKIEISEGRGNYRQQWNQLEDIGGTGIRYEELSGIRIPLGAGREISCRWQAGNGTAGRKADSPKAEMRAAESRENGKYTVSGRNEWNEGDKRDERDECNERDVNKREAEEAGGSVKRNLFSMVEKETVLQKDNAMDIMGRGENGIGKTQIDADKEVLAEDGRRDEFGSRERKDSDEEGGRGMRGRRKGGRRESFDREAGETARPYAAGSTDGQAQTGNVLEQRAAGREQRGNALEQRAAGREQRGNAGEQRMAKQGQRGNTGEQRTVKQEQESEPIKLLENKWAQLWAIYPHIRPFQDEREYISIGPSDFVLFPEAYYKRANNSFLLHGFYNYRHLLLARVERRGEVMYYIGVPGTYFEKEKQVAVMFGFESFECAEEPAQAGDFGYYMMRTGL